MRLRRTVLAAEAFGYLVLARFALWLLPVRWLLRYAERAAWYREPRDVPATVKEVRWAVLAAVRHAPLQLVCFPQCLAALTMLRVRGIGSRLHYGATRLQGRLATHTWLEADGHDVIGGEAARDYTLLAVYEPSSRSAEVTPKH